MAFLEAIIRAWLRRAASAATATAFDIYNAHPDDAPTQARADVWHDWARFFDHLSRGQ